jgi:hypothetical protein
MSMVTGITDYRPIQALASCSSISISRTSPYSSYSFCFDLLRRAPASFMPGIPVDSMFSRGPLRNRSHYLRGCLLAASRDEGVRERRYAEGSIGDDEFYPTNAAWAGLFDRFSNPRPEEVLRRSEIRRGGFAA